LVKVQSISTGLLLASIIGELFCNDDAQGKLWAQQDLLVIARSSKHQAHENPTKCSVDVRRQIKTQEPTNIQKLGGDWQST
jgi:hypothetical protein